MIEAAATTEDSSNTGVDGMSESYRFIVSGKVQGVGFRQAVMGKALVLGLRGLR